MSAPRGYEHKTGEGRARTKPPAVPSVETLPCPESPGTHLLRNTPAGITRCVGCRRTWADLDGELRARIGWKGRLTC